MVEHRPVLTFFTHLILALGVLIVALPLYVTFVATTAHVRGSAAGADVAGAGPSLVEELRDGPDTRYGRFYRGGGPDDDHSFVSAMVIAVGKIVISLLSAFAIVYFRFRFRSLAFWLIFVTLMLPVEVRILPTYKVVSDLGMLDSYAGLTVPLIASATATFLFRQFLSHHSDELAEAARIDGAGPMRFFWGRRRPAVAAQHCGPVRDPVHLRLESVSMAAAGHHTGGHVHRGDRHQAHDRKRRRRGDRLESRDGHRHARDAAARDRRAARAAVVREGAGGFGEVTGENVRGNAKLNKG